MTLVCVVTLASSSTVVSASLYSTLILLPTTTSCTLYWCLFLLARSSFKKVGRSTRMSDNEENHWLLGLGDANIVVPKSEKFNARAQQAE